MSRPGLARVALALAIAATIGGCAHLVVLHDPLSAAEHNDLGVAYEASGKLPLAAKQYRRALRLDPRFSSARVNLGNIEAAQGRWPAAERSYRRALRDSTTNADAMNNLAIALLRQRRRLDEALALAERAAATGGPKESVYRATLEEVRAGGK